MMDVLCRKHAKTRSSRPIATAISGLESALRAGYSASGADVFG
jgi:hypothetical protein